MVGVDMLASRPNVSNAGTQTVVTGGVLRTLVDELHSGIRHFAACFGEIDGPTAKALTPQFAFESRDISMSLDPDVRELAAMTEMAPASESLPNCRFAASSSSSVDIGTGPCEPLDLETATPSTAALSDAVLMSTGATSSSMSVITSNPSGSTDGGHEKPPGLKVPTTLQVPESWGGNFRTCCREAAQHRRYNWPFRL